MVPPYSIESMTIHASLSPNTSPNNWVRRKGSEKRPFGSNPSILAKRKKFDFFFFLSFYSILSQILVLFLVFSFYLFFSYSLLCALPFKFWLLFLSFSNSHASLLFLLKLMLMFIFIFIFTIIFILLSIFILISIFQYFIFLLDFILLVYSMWTFAPFYGHYWNAMVIVNCVFMYSCIWFDMMLLLWPIFSLEL